MWTNAEFGKENDVAAISSPTVVAEESLCFNFWFDLTVRLYVVCTVYIILHCISISSIHILLDLGNLPENIDIIDSNIFKMFAAA